MYKHEKEIIQAQLDKEKAVLDELEYEYSAALKQINEKIMILQSDELTQSRIYQIQYQKALKGQVQAILEKLHADEYSTIQQYLSDSYSDSFIAAMYSFHKQKVPIILPIDKKAAVKAVLTDSKIKGSLYEALGINVEAMKKSISQEITRGIASGLSYSDIIRNLRNATKAPYANAKTIVRTEGHRIQQASTEDARQGAKAKGADVVKQWDATMDGATRPTHQRLDGQIKETHEPFEYGSKKAMYPGDFGDPAEDCNCRCVALTRARWALDEDELATLKERAEVFKLDKADSFEDFKEKYLTATKVLDNSGKSGIIKRGENYVSNKGFIIHQDKIEKFCLKPGSKHYNNFVEVGYSYKPGALSFESKLLALDIENGYDIAKATERVIDSEGKERFTIYMNLGFNGGKRFKTVWRIEEPGAAPRFITAYRRDKE